MSEEIHADEMPADTTHTGEGRSAAASLFDLRTVIALLFGVYGVLLLIIALVNSTPEQLAKSGGIHLNLWASIVMLVLAAGFLAWVRLRPPVAAAPGDGAGGTHR